MKRQQQAAASYGPDKPAPADARPAPSKKSFTKSTSDAVGSAGPVAGLWLAGVSFIAWRTITRDEDYLTKTSDALWQATALTALFFILALTYRARAARQLVIGFAVLVDLGLLLTSVSDIKPMLNRAAGKINKNPSDTEQAALSTAVASYTPSDPGHTFLTSSAATDTATTESATLTDPTGTTLPPTSPPPAKSGKLKDPTAGEAPIIAPPPASGWSFV